MRISTTPGLFLETLHTISDILAQNAEREPFRHFIEGVWEKFGERHINVTIYRGRPEIEVDHFTIRFTSGRFELVGRGRESEVSDWRLPHAFLENVVDNQDTYRANAELMDWACLAALLAQGQ